MLVDDYGNLLFENIIEFIQSYLKKFNLDENDMLIYGASKGGEIALRFLKFFQKSTGILCVPQVDLGYFLSRRKGINDILIPIYGKIFDENHFEYLENTKQKIYYFYAIDDSSSNANFIEYLKNNKIIKIPHIGKHSHVSIHYKHFFFNAIIDFCCSNLDKTFDVEVDYFKIYNDENYEVKIKINLRRQKSDIFLFEIINNDGGVIYLPCALGYDEKNVVNYVGSRRYEKTIFPYHTWKDVSEVRVVIFDKNFMKYTSNLIDIEFIDIEIPNVL